MSPCSGGVAARREDGGCGQMSQTEIGPQLQRGLDLTKRVIGTVERAERGGVVDASVGIVRSAAHGSFKIPGGLGQVASRGQSVGEVALGRGQIRFDPKGFAELGLRARQIARTRQQFAQRVVRFRVIGVEC